ncbi:MAG: GNAT family N-acetyltransferase [Pirellulales bacterium]|nr:GNAT family N-acetyltransferase [Pirellulales bacterium]
MLRFRSFRNTDPPELVRIWRSRGRQPGLYQPISVDVLEQVVLGKPHFDYAGLQLAWEEDRLVGFAHAGFGASESGKGISTELGTTCMVMVRPDCDCQVVANGLLVRCEAYLIASGAKVLYGGGIQPLNPFYFGLYGGSELPGVLASDMLTRELFERHGYRLIDETCIFHGNLHTVRTPITRHQMHIRRQMLVQIQGDPPSRTWWEACTTGDFERLRFELLPRGGGPPCAYALVRGMEPGASLGANRVAGLTELHVDTPHRRRGFVLFLLSEVFHHLARLGVDRLEVQTMAHNTAAVSLYHKLGFVEIDRGLAFRKDVSVP